MTHPLKPLSFKPILDLSNFEDAALTWYVERIRLQHCMANQVAQRVGLAEQDPDKFKANLRKALLSSPNAQETIGNVSKMYREFLADEYFRPTSQQSQQASLH